MVLNWWVGTQKWVMGLSQGKIETLLESKLVSSPVGLDSFGLNVAPKTGLKVVQNWTKYELKVE